MRTMSRDSRRGGGTKPSRLELDCKLYRESGILWGTPGTATERSSIRFGTSLSVIDGLLGNECVR